MAWLWARLGPWLAAIGATIVAIAGAFAAGAWRGKRAQADHDAAKTAKAEAAAAESARQTYVDANDAAAKVRRDAAQQAPPDTDKRDDFDSHF